ncbi:MAG TPA: hypothetical protein P5244_11295, partial [Syntrophales bacterium]|nr:hypothetical protein [Syntrophales bacterium]
MEDESTGMWRGLWISLLITPLTPQMSRFSTGLHKVWAAKMLSVINKLKVFCEMSAIFMCFLKSYKLFEKNVPFSHLMAVFL